MRGDDVESSKSHGGEMNAIEAGAVKVTDEELASYFVCSLILLGPSSYPFLSVMAHQDDPRKCGGYYISGTV